MGRSPSCDENGLKKGPWTPEEDGKLVSYIQKHGHGSWRALPKLAGLNRCGKSCRLRWTNYLRPDIKRGKFTEEESQIIINWHSILGNKWSAIASHLPGRTDNEIKNFWNTHLRKKLLQMGIDPVTHRPRTDLNFLANLPQLLAAANIANFTNPWDNALISMLQSDATQLAKIQFLHNMLQVLNMNVTTPANWETLNSFGSSSITGTQLYHELPRVISSKHEGHQKSSINVCPINHIETDILNFQTVLQQSAAKPSTDHHIDPKDENLTNAYPMSLPILVPASTERPAVKEIEKKISSTDLSNPSSTSTTLDRWEDFMDDEASDSYWKDLIDQQTSQPW